MNKFFLTLLVLMNSLLVSCNDGSSVAPDTKMISSTENVGSQVLATIDGVDINESQLDSLLINMFGKYKAAQMDAKSRQRALDSMLAGYALTQEALGQLPKNQINIIEEKTRRYRENLLINAYMQTKMDAATLSSEKIKDYYKNNIEEFGSKSIKEYQLLTTQKALEEESRDKFLETVSKNRKKENLTAIKESLEKRAFDVKLHTGVLDKNLLGQRLYAFIDSQSLNKISEITFIDGKPYIVMLTSIKTSKAKPLNEVRDTIRKSLVLKQLKQTIKEQSTVALEKSNIVYRDR